MVAVPLHPASRQYTPTILEFQKNVFEGVAEGFERANVDSILQKSTDSTALRTNKGYPLQLNPTKIFKGASNAVNKILYMSDFTKTWMIRFGYLGLIMGLLYIIGGVFLLILKPFSVNLAYGVLILSIIFSVIQALTLSGDASRGIVALTAGFSHAFGIIIDIVLIVVILASDKTAYQGNHDLT